MEQLLIVGGGLAGTLLALECTERGMSFDWLTTHEIPSASMAAYGICNPVHIRNGVLAWKAEEFLETSGNAFKKWCNELKVDAYFTMPVNHLVSEEDELVQWRQNVEITDLWKYSNGEPQHRFHPRLSDDFIAEIRINHCFYLDMPLFIEAVRQKLKVHIIEEKIQWEELNITPQQIQYHNKNYQKVIVADGSYSTENPFWTYIPFNLCKGEVLVVKIKGLNIDEAIHKKLMLIPLHDDVFICGATYEWKDLSFEITENGKVELMELLQVITGGKYEIEILEQKAGVRPTMPDRRPVVGWHPQYNNVGIVNGLGTKGLMLGPMVVKNILESISNNQPILSDWDVARFNKRFEKYSHKV